MCILLKIKTIKMKTIIITIILRIISFVAFSANLFFEEDVQTESLSIYTDKIVEYQRIYDIKLNDENNEKIWVMYESLVEDIDTYLYSINLQFTEENNLWLFSSIIWEVNILPNWKIEDFRINAWPTEINWELDPHRQEKILINYQRYNLEESELLEISNFNIDILFNKLLPVIERKKWESKNIEIVDIISSTQSWQINNNTVKVTKNSESEFIAYGEIFWREIETKYKYDADWILEKQENPFFIYKKSESQAEDELEELDLQIDWWNWSETWNWEDSNQTSGESDDLQCKIIWIDD